MAKASPFPWHLILAILVFGIMLFAVYYSISSPLAIYPEEAKEILARGGFDHVVDVRTPMEWKTGRYPLAIHIPVGTIPTTLPARIPDKKAKILFYCNTSARARQAAEMAREMGYLNVYYLVGTHANLM